VSTPYPGFVSPIPAGTTFLRIDQGVDYDAPAPCVAVYSGTVSHVSPVGSFAGGTGQAVYITLDKAVTVNGHTYSQVYYAERAPLVQQGSSVFAGQAVMASGTNELGFASGNSPACGLVGGLGAGTQPTVCGQDFYDFVQALQSQLVPLPPPPGGGALPPPGSQPQGAGGIFVPFAPPPDAVLGSVPTHATRAWSHLMRQLGVTLPSAARAGRLVSRRMLPAVTIRRRRQ